MLSATVYHIIHVASLLLLSGLAYGLAYSDHKKPLKIAYGIASFLVLLGGFGLMARMGYGFKENAWLTGKLLIWLALSAGVPIAIKRFSLKPSTLVISVSSLLTVAVILIYVRP